MIINQINYSTDIYAILLVKKTANMYKKYKLLFNTNFSLLLFR